MDNLDFNYNNGGSKFKPRKDCVVRAISIATKQDYMEVLKQFTILMDKPAYRGVPRKIYDLYLKNLGCDFFSITGSEIISFSSFT